MRSMRIISVPFLLVLIFTMMHANSEFDIENNVTSMSFSNLLQVNDYFEWIANTVESDNTTITSPNQENFLFSQGSKIRLDVLANPSDSSSDSIADLFRLTINNNEVNLTLVEDVLFLFLVPANITFSSSEYDTDYNKMLVWYALIFDDYMTASYSLNVTRNSVFLTGIMNVTYDATMSLILNYTIHNDLGVVTHFNIFSIVNSIINLKIVVDLVDTNYEFPTSLTEDTPGDIDPTKSSISELSLQFIGLTLGLIFSVSVLKRKNT